MSLDVATELCTATMLYKLSLISFSGEGFGYLSMGENTGNNEYRASTSAVSQVGLVQTSCTRCSWTVALCKDSNHFFLGTSSFDSFVCDLMVAGL